MKDTIRGDPNPKQIAYSHDEQITSNDRESKDGISTGGRFSQRGNCGGQGNPIKSN